MPCENCDCFKCRENDEEYNDCEVINPPPKSSVHSSRPVPTTEVWKEHIASLFRRYNNSNIDLASICAMVMHSVGCKPEDYKLWSENLTHYIKTSPDYVIRKGRYGGGVSLKIPDFRSILVWSGGDVLGHAVETTVKTKPVDDYTCGCGNKKLSTLTDKLCWSCGEPVKKV